MTDGNVRRVGKQMTAALWLVPGLMLSLAACSGGGSSDKSDTGKEPVEETASRQPASLPAPAPTNSGGGNPVVDATDDADNDRVTEEVDRDVLIRRLDRVVAGTDERILRNGLRADAAAAVLSMDELQALLDETQTRWSHVRSSVTGEQP